ncbi:MAG: hypothetical protein PHX08_01055 [Lachnospiraceae bacterium]|nr:hypothetical protein [Lachnospiraceae bacterium]
MNQRIEELKKYFKDSQNPELVEALIEEFVFLEGNLTQLKKLPFIEVHPTMLQKQRQTPASRQYKELLQQYVNVIKTLTMVSGKKEEDEESPLRKWVKRNVDKKENNMDTG